MLINLLKKIGLVKLSIAGIGILFFSIIFSIIWQPRQSDGKVVTISGDGSGYYMYLPSIFISGEFGHEKTDYRHLVETPSGVMNKYNAGTAILISPFFTIACLYYSYQGLEFTGYESLFHKMVSIAALFYFLFGLFGLSQLLKAFHFKPRTIAVTILLLAFGTNTLIYTLNAPAFSHIYGFFAISFFLLFLKRFIESSKTNHLILAAVFLGITILIRPFDVLIVLAFPFLAMSWKALAASGKALFNRPLRLIICILIVISIFSIQQVLWFIETGSIVFYGYNNEGFYFTKPQILKSFFSFRKGVFIYTPLAFIALLGLIPIYKRTKFGFFSYGIFSLILVYIISSWWIWYYGPGFGLRPLIDFYPLLFIPLPFLIESLKTSYVKWTFGCLAVICVSLNLIQSYQYHNQILPTSDLNKAKYYYIFGRTDDGYKNVLGGLADMKPYHNTEQEIFKASTGFEKEDRFIKFSNTVYHSLSQSVVVDYSGQEFNTSVDIPIDSRYSNDKHAFIQTQLDLLELSNFQEGEQALIVFDLSDSIGNSYYYVATPLKDIPVYDQNVWKHLDYGLILPIRHKSDKFSVYIWNKPKGNFYIDNVRIDVFTYE